MLPGTLKFIQTRSGPERRFSSGLSLFAFALFMLLSLSACDTAANDPVVEASPASLEERFGMKASLTANLDEKTIRKLRTDFKRKLSQEMDQLKREEKQIKKNSQNDRRSRRRDWNKKEQSARHQYFKENSRGPERRAYVKEFIERRNQLHASQKDEEVQERRMLDAKRKSLEEDQRNRLNQFEEALARKERPSETLWNPTPPPSP